MRSAGARMATSGAGAFYQPRRREDAASPLSAASSIFGGLKAVRRKRPPFTAALKSAPDTRGVSVQAVRGAETNADTARASRHPVSASRKHLRLFEAGRVDRSVEKAVIADALKLCEHFVSADHLKPEYG
jgi:hypothetical protein